MNRSLLERYFKGNVTDRERCKVAEWVAKSQDNLNEYMAARRLYDSVLLSDEFNDAQLSINPKELSIDFEDYYKVYDGKAIKSSDLEYKVVGLINEHKFVFTEEFETMLAECISAKTNPYEINFIYEEYASLYKIVDKDGYDVTNYYTELDETFTITVDKKDLYVYGYNGSLILNDSKSIDDEYDNQNEDENKESKSVDFTEEDDEKDPEWLTNEIDFTKEGYFDGDEQYKSKYILK
jgi:hypothetical protein